MSNVLGVRDGQISRGYFSLTNIANVRTVCPGFSGHVNSKSRSLKKFFVQKWIKRKNWKKRCFSDSRFDRGADWSSDVIAFRELRDPPSLLHWRKPKKSSTIRYDPIFFRIENYSEISKKIVRRNKNKKQV